MQIDKGGLSTKYETPFYPPILYAVELNETNRSPTAKILSF